MLVSLPSPETPPREWLQEMEACSEALKWASTQPTLRDAWRACERPDWLLWILDKVNARDDVKDRLFACWCVRYTPLKDGRKVWDLLTDERSRRAVEVAERFANGGATAEELDAARAAARDAACDAAWAAARAAAWAAARAAAWAAARDAALAARDAARNATAARDAAWDAAAKAQADALRTIYGDPWKSASSS